MKRFVLLISLLITLVAQGKDKVYVAVFSTVGTQAHTGIGASVYLTDRINAYGKYDAIMPQHIEEEAHVESLNEARESAEVLTAPYFILGRIVKIEQHIEVSATLYAQSSGMAVWSYSDGTRQSDDITLILDYVAAHLGSVKNWSQPGDAFRMTEHTTEPFERQKANLSLGASVDGKLFLTEKDPFDDRYALAPGYGLLLSADVRNFIMMARYEFNRIKYEGVGIYYPEYVYNYHSFGVDVIYPIYSTNNAPFASLGAAYVNRITSITTKNLKTGLDNESRYEHDTYLRVDGGIGYMVRRNARASLMVSAKGFVMVNSVWGYHYGVQMGAALMLGKRN